MEDVDGSFVVVLQRGPHHHIVVGILIEVAHPDDGGPESGVLVVVGILQCPVVNKPVLEKQGQEKAQGDLARALGVTTPSGLQPPLSPLSQPLSSGYRGASSLLGLAQQRAWASPVTQLSSWKPGRRKAPGAPGWLPVVPPKQYLSQVVDVHPASLSALAEVHGGAHQQHVSHTVAVDVHRGDLAPVVRAYLRHRAGGRTTDFDLEFRVNKGEGPPLLTPLSPLPPFHGVDTPCQSVLPSPLLSLLYISAPHFFPMFSLIDCHFFCL